MSDKELKDRIPILYNKTVEEITNSIKIVPKLKIFFLTHTIGIDKIIRVLQDDEPSHRIKRFIDALINFYRSECAMSETY